MFLSLILFFCKVQCCFSKSNFDLSVQVDVNADKHRQEMSNVLQLSGGEKSFSTVCLLMALWDSVDSPIRAMDEFDVCMVSMIRENSFELLLLGILGISGLINNDAFTIVHILCHTIMLLLTCS